MENKLKHLEFIQNVITRMNSNSFLIKGWTITITAALFALAAQGTNGKYILITYIVVPVFWILDGFFISQERQYRGLYKEVAQKTENEIDFNMDATKYNEGNKTWQAGILSKTIWPFYGITLIAIIIVMIIMV